MFKRCIYNNHINNFNLNINFMALWKIDPTHSEVKFKVKHLVISTVTGHFNNFSATLDTSKDDFTDARIKFEAHIDSIDTKNAQRDGHLKSPDFFDAVNHPKLTFASTSVTKIDESEYKVKGDLVIRETKKEVTLNVTYNGAVKGFGGISVIAFEITGKVNRQDFGLSWNALTEAGGVVVSDEVKFEIFAEFNLAQPEVKETVASESAAA
jgi:polyisoprenoid-binding protein YceI